MSEAMDAETIDGREAGEVGNVPLEEIARMSGEEFLRKLVARELPAPPISRHMNFAAVEAERGRVVFAGTPSAKHLNPMGVVHGGWVSTLLDSALGCAGQTLCEPGYGSTSVDLRVNFTRPITPKTGRLVCEAKVVHPGRQLATVEARVTGEADGKLYAHGSQTVLIFRIPAA